MSAPLRGVSSLRRGRSAKVNEEQPSEIAAAIPPRASETPVQQRSDAAGSTRTAQRETRVEAVLPSSEPGGGSFDVATNHSRQIAPASPLTYQGRCGAEKGRRVDVGDAGTPYDLLRDQKTVSRLWFTARTETTANRDRFR